MSEDEGEGSLPPPESPPPPTDPASAWEDEDGGGEEAEGQKKKSGPVALECSWKAFFVIGITIIGVLVVVLYFLRPPDECLSCTTEVAVPEPTRPKFTSSSNAMATAASTSSSAAAVVLTTTRPPITKPYRNCFAVLLNLGDAFYPRAYNIKESYEEEASLAWCDPDGWTVFQSRGQFGNSNSFFYRVWEDYKNGFGSPGRDHWLGLERLHVMTSKRTYALRIRLMDNSGVVGQAYYSAFSLENSTSNYVLNLGAFLGNRGELQNIGDSLTHHRGQPFSTKDRRSNGNDCAETSQGAWWFTYCLHSNLNGFNYNAKGLLPGKGVLWKSFRGMTHSLRETEMALMPIDNGTYLDCSEVLSDLGRKYASGEYLLRAEGGTSSFIAHCDPTGWTVLQNNSKTAAAGTIQNYERPFGSNGVGRRWIGLRMMSYLTNQGRNYTLRIRLVDQEGIIGQAMYGSFSVTEKSDRFRLNVGPYLGNQDQFEDIGDSLTQLNGRAFNSSWWSPGDGERKSSNLNAFEKAGGFLTWNSWSGHDVVSSEMSLLLNSEVQGRSLCNLRGRCAGQMLADLSRTHLTQNQCQETCRDRDGCEFYTYDSTAMFCTLYLTCPLESTDSATCKTCVSGARNCHASPLLLVVSGGIYPHSTHGTSVVELVWLDLAGRPRRETPYVPTYPSIAVGGVGTSFFRGLKPLVCGATGHHMERACFFLDAATCRWESGKNMSRARGFSASSLHPDRGWVVTGNYYSVYKGLPSSMEGEESDFEEWSAPLHPEVYLHCQVTVGLDLFVFGGGDKTGKASGWDGLDDASDRAFKWTPDTDAWISLPRMPRRRKGPSCGLSQESPSKRVVVVAGGHETAGRPVDDIAIHDSVDLFVVADETWKEGPRLPGPRTMAASVPFDKTFAIVGGADSRNALSTVVMYRPESDSWQVVANLTVPRHSAVVIPVEWDPFQNC